MDKIDRRLLTLLTHDSRMSITTLANHLDLARATVQNRISRLVDSGVIKRFTVELGDNYEKNALKALCLIQIEAGRAVRLSPEFKKIPQVTRILSTSAPYDYVIEIIAGTVNELDEIVFQIRNLNGVMRTETSIVLND